MKTKTYNSERVCKPHTWWPRTLRRCTKLALVVAALCAGYTGIAVADLHGNRLSTATPAIIDSKIAGRINTAGDADFFRIEIPSSGRLTALTTGPTDTIGKLYNASKQRIGSNNNSGGRANFKIQRDVEAGSYFVRVKHSSKTGTGAYAFKAKFVSDSIDDYGNSATTATQLGLNRSVAGSIETPADTDYFRITIVESGTVILQTAGISDTFAHLYDSRGNLLISRDDQGAGDNFRIAGSISPGTYYLAVSLFNPLAVGDYSLGSAYQPAEPDDHGNTRSTATNVYYKSDTAAGIEAAGDVDYFRIDLPTEGTLSVSTSGSTDTRGDLYNSASARLAANDDGGPGKNFKIAGIVGAGSYYLRVRNASISGVGAYTLKVRFINGDDHGDELQTATLVQVNSSIAGSIESDGDVDYFRFDLTEGGTISIDSLGTTDTVGKLFDSAGRLLAEIDDLGSGVNFGITGRINPGTHYVSVKHFRPTGTGNYTLSIGFSESGRIDDHSDALGSATPIGNNSVIAGEINSALDMDYFRIDIPINGDIVLRSDGDTSLVGTLYNGLGDILDVDGENGAGHINIVRGIAEGTYYIGVHHIDPRGKGKYELQVNFNAAVDDHGNIFTTATDVGNNSLTVGNIETVGDVDMFRIELPRGGTLSMFTLGTMDTVGSIYNGSGSLLITNDDGGPNDNFGFSGVASAGVFYILVRHADSTGGNGSYSLSVSFQ